MEKRMEIKYSGFVSLAGRPNVGKSTLLNALMGQKIAIVSPKPQTTRGRVVGIKTAGDRQIVFIDTPGLHSPRTALGDFMVKTAQENIEDTDIVLLVVEARGAVHKLERDVIEWIKRTGQRSILVINKVDTVKDKPRILAVIEAFSALHDFDAVVPLSAKSGRGVEILEKELLRLIPEGIQYYPEDMVSDQPERVRAAEIIREKMLYALSDEIPHGVAVEVYEFAKRDGRALYDISVNIICERKTHKSIIIGKGGEKLKAIATAARVELEEMLGAKVNLQCWIKVKEDWRNNRYLIRNYGYE